MVKAIVGWVFQFILNLLLPSPACMLCAGAGGPTGCALGVDVSDRSSTVRDHTAASLPHIIFFFLIQLAFLLNMFKVAKLGVNALRYMFQKAGTEKQVIHLDIDIQLRNIMPRRAQDCGQ